MLVGAVTAEVVWGCSPRALQTGGQHLPGYSAASVGSASFFQGSVSGKQDRLHGGNPEPDIGMCCAVHPGPPRSGADDYMCP